LTKNVCPGDLTSEYHRLLDLLLKVFNEAVSYAKDGASFPELDRLTRSRIAEGGYPGQPSHPICHGVGARAHEPPYAHQAGTGTIRKGMVLAIEPGFTGRAAAACGWRTIFGSRMRGIKNSARIQMIFGWRVPPARRDELVTTPART